MTGVSESGRIGRRRLNYIPWLRRRDMGWPRATSERCMRREEEFGRIQKKHSICICPPRSRERPTAKTTWESCMREEWESRRI